MWSRLLPRAEAGEVRAIKYQTVCAAGGTSASQVERKAEKNQPEKSQEHARENEQLRARVAELEQALAQQVTAARQTGFREGEAAGARQAEAATKPVIERMIRSIQDLIELKPQLRKEFEEDAVKLSLGIAKRVLRREMSVDPSALHGLVQVAFDRMGKNDIARVVVHPEHVEPVREMLAQLTTRNVEIVADGAREKGALIFETNRGAVDASVDTQLREIELGFADRLKWR